MQTTFKSGNQREHPTSSAGVRLLLLGALATLAVTTRAIAAVPYNFSTGNPDGLMATASRPGSMSAIEIESADDFVVNGLTTIDHATFAGLLPSGLPLTAIAQVRVEIYRVFPQDSDVGRTSGPPTFSTSQVPTRVNSPADVEVQDRDTGTNTLIFTANILTASFTAGNSVLNGINPQPNQTTGGDGPVTGEEVLFDVTFTPPFVLPADHYFFVPQVELTSGDFFWLSAAKPIVPPGTPFSPDLQSWIRNTDLDPDWLRIGTDIVGGAPAPTFNATFSLNGQVSVDLSISKTAPASVLTNSPVAYLIDVSNAQVSTTATNVTVVDTLPAGTTFVGFSGAGWSCVESPAGTVTCTLASLDPGMAAPPLTLNVVTPSVAARLANQATVSADQTDIQPADNVATAVTQVTAVAPTLGGVGLVMLTALLMGVAFLGLRKVV